MGAPFALTAAIPVMRRANLFNESEENMEPLSGQVDGLKRTFKTPHKPLIIDPTGLYGAPCTFALYDARENPIDLSAYTLTSARAGTIQFLHAPTIGGTGNILRPLWPYYASYTWADLDLGTLWGCLRQGFDEMESRLNRGFQLVSTGSPTPVVGQLDYAVVDSQGQDPRGPNNTTFATSAIQLDLLAQCALYRMARDYAWAAGKFNFATREGRMGMEINPTAALKTQIDHLKLMTERLNLAVGAAQTEWDAEGNSMGGFISNPRSQGYQTWFNWQGTAQYPVPAITDFPSF